MLPYFKKLEAENLEDISKEIYLKLPSIDVHLEHCQKNNLLRYDSLVDRNSSSPRKDLLRVIFQFPLLMKWLETKGIDQSDILSIVRFYIPGNSKMNIHIDGNGELSRQGLFGEAINIPVHNCQDSYTAWFDAEPYFLSEEEATALLGPDHLSKYGLDTHNSRLKSFQTGLAFKEDTAREIARVKLDTAIWYNISLPHQGINLNSDARIMLSMRFNRKIDIDKL